MCGKFLQFASEFALAAAHDRRQQHHPGLAAGFALASHLQNARGDLLRRLAADGPPALGTMGNADGAVQQTQVVVDLRDGADRRARAARGRLLLDADGRAEAVNGVHVGALHLVQELARVGRKCLHVAALALGIDGVKGERAFAAAAQPGDHRQRVARDGNVNVLQVVLARAAHRDVADAHWLRFPLQGPPPPVPRVRQNLRRANGHPYRAEKTVQPSILFGNSGRGQSGQ